MSTGKLLSVDDALKLEMRIDIEEQIALRVELMSQMVGRLYPSILGEEILKLEDNAKQCKPPQ